MDRLSDSTRAALKTMPEAAQKELNELASKLCAEEPESVNLLFVRHAECMHTAAVGIPSAILPKYVDAATRPSVEPLVVSFDGVRCTSEGEWKKLAATAPFSTLTKADTPLLPSELAKGTHVSRLRQVFEPLAELPFLSASPPLLRMKTTAALAHAAYPAHAGLQTCHLSALLLPRPSPLHTRDDTRAYATAAAAAAAEPVTAPDDALMETLQTVVGQVERSDAAALADAAKRARAVADAMRAYTSLDESGGFAADDEADAAATAACEAAGTAALAGAKFARWAFGLAARSRCTNLVVFGGSGWWAGLVRDLGAELSPAERDAVLPSLAISDQVVDADGAPLALPMMPPPAGARFVRLTRAAAAGGGGGCVLRVPTVAQAADEKDAFASAALGVNPTRPEGTERDEWLRGLLAKGECCSY